jgi:FkbM family methyltransferase
MKTYYYFNDSNYPIQVTDSTLELTPYTFKYDGLLWENKALFQFYSQISKNEKYNIVDIGAQSGLYSLYAKYLPQSTFYSFEPFPSTFALLNDNIILNDIQNVKTFNIALSNECGEKTLNTCKSHYGLHTLGANPSRFSDIEPIQVTCNTLDNLFYSNNIPVHYIKIDTEGYEYYILQGGIQTLKQYRPIIQLEWSEINMKQANVVPQMLLDFFRDLNYVNVGQQDEEHLFVPL